MPIGEIVLHVGMHKTGTTSIQHALDGYDDGRIAYADLKIPRNRTPNHGVALETIFRSDFENTPHHRKFSRTPDVIRGFRAGFAARLDQQLALDRETLILCGEAIPRLKADELAALHAKLRTATERVTIYVYLRDPVGFCSSMFQQQCKSPVNMARPKVPGPGYRRKFQKFIDAFGATNVRFVLYDRDTLRDGSSVADFAMRLGIPNLPQAARVNTGLSADATRCLYILRTACGIDFTQNDARIALRAVVKLLETGMTGPAFRLPEAAVASVVPAPDVAWVNDVSGASFIVPAGEMSAEALHDDLSRISETGQQQLTALVAATGQRPEPGAAPADLVRLLFAASLKSARGKAWLARIMDIVAARFVAPGSA